MINKGRSAPISGCFEIQQLNLSGARAVLRNTIGFAPKDKIFKKYIEIEQQLGNMDRCRKLYEKYLEWSPENCYAWSKYAELERSLMETMPEPFLSLLLHNLH
ncbi:crooked neck-like protein 1 [Tanacetum coccineum]